MTSRTDQTRQAIRLASTSEQIEQQERTAVEEALSAPTKPIFNTYSQALAGRLIAEERSLKETMADIQAKKEELDAQMVDAMLAHSGVAAALNALQHNR